MCKDKLIPFVFFVLACTLIGCAVTTSGNMVGEAAAVRYSTDEKKYRVADVGLTFAAAGKSRHISSLHSDVEISGGSLNLKASVLSLNYALWGQKGGLFLSVPLTIPLDVGIRSSLVQWIGPFYLGAGVSFVGGFYPNEQDDDYEPKADDSFGQKQGKENLPAYSKRVDVMTLGLNVFVKMKSPLGFYAEYSPGKLMYNDGWWKIRAGVILLY